MISDNFAAPMQHYQLRINDFLQQQHHRLQQQSSETQHYAPQLLDAIAYSTLNGGKRIRPLLIYATAHALHQQLSTSTLATLDYAAAAVEYIHCYSLVHDDLPAMDDDDLRRGQPTCHRQFDEATAILVGDALQTEAFKLLTQISDNNELCIKLLTTLLQASGLNGLIGGQAIDLAATNCSSSLQQLQTMHQLKTGALISASVRLGALICSASPQQLTLLKRFSDAIGLAFQIQDDILDVQQHSNILGKTSGSDAANNKTTYPKLLGLETAKEQLQALLDDAQHALHLLDGDTQFLEHLARFIIVRQS